MMPLDDHSSADTESNFSEDETKKATETKVNGDPHPLVSQEGTSSLSSPQPVYTIRNKYEGPLDLQKNDENHASPTKSDEDEERDTLPIESDCKDENLDYFSEFDKEKDENQATHAKSDGDLLHGFRGFSIPVYSSTDTDCSSETWRMELKEEELLMVKIKTPQNNADGERDEKIPKEEAVCKVCFKIFTDDNVLKIKCGCKFTLLHENCRNQISSTKCKVCDQDTQYIPVMLTGPANNENQSSHNNRSRNWMACFGGKA